MRCSLRIGSIGKIVKKSPLTTQNTIWMPTRSASHLCTNEAIRANVMLFPHKTGWPRSHVRRTCHGRRPADKPKRDHEKQRVQGQRPH